MYILDRIVAPGTHFVSRHADGMSAFVEGDIIRGAAGRFDPAVDVNECIDVPVFQRLGTIREAKKIQEELSDV